MCAGEGIWRPIASAPAARPTGARHKPEAQAKGFAEAFACFGHPILADSGQERSAAEWNVIFSQAVESTCDVLSARVQLRDPAMFEPLLEGRAGVGGIYDLWRASKARIQGKSWRPEHGGR